MLILDTDHLSEIDRGSVVGQLLRTRLITARHPVATTIISVEEQLRGRLAQLSRTKDPTRLIAFYSILQVTVVGYGDWQILPWDDPSVAVLKRLRGERLGLGTMDLRISCIVLANRGMLLTRNLRDFQRVPDLQVEDWLA